jgi:predicted MFS family arabinose efflux permease
MLTVIFTARISMGFQFQSIASVATFIVDDLHLSYAQVGLLMGLYMIPGVLIALPGGLLAQRFSPLVVAAAGLALMIAGAETIARGDAFALAAAGRVVSGVGGILLNVALAKMVADWFTGRELSTAMGVMLASFPAGLGLAAAVLGSVARAHSWRAAADATAVVSALALLLLLGLYRAPAERPSQGAPRLALTRRTVALALTAGATWALFNASFIIFASFAPAFLLDRGLPVATAGLLLSVAVWISIVSVGVFGWVTDRLGRVDLMIGLGVAASALVMLAVPLSRVEAPWFVLLGVSLGVPAGALMTLLPRALAADDVAAGFGVYYTVFYLAMTIAQPAAGWARDVSGRAEAPLVLAVVVMLATLPAVAAFRLRERRAAG